jgi:tetratricopeptide (TPR) repeat protein
LYQKSIALYLRGDYGEAEVGLNEAYEEFRFLRNDAQMAYSVYHLAEMNRRRGSLRQALNLYDKSRTMFEHMGKEPEDTGDSRMGNEFMVAISLECQVELFAKLCQPDKAKQAYSRAHALLKNIEGRGKHCRLDFRSIHDKCEIWRDGTFQLLTVLFLAGMVFYLLFIHRLLHGRL